MMVLRKNHLCTLCKDHLWTSEERKGEDEDFCGLGLGVSGVRRSIGIEIVISFEFHLCFFL